jgi:hypothetical protein
MTLPEAEFTANEFNKFTAVQSAEVVPNVDGDYSVLVTRTDGRRDISRDLDAANDAHAALWIEQSYAQAVCATLGEGNVPVFCSRETWKAWWEENAAGKLIKSEQSGDFVTEVIFTGFPSEVTGRESFGRSRLATRRPACVTRSEASLPSRKRLRFWNRPNDQARRSDCGLAIPKIHRPHRSSASPPTS